MVDCCQFLEEREIESARLMQWNGQWQRVDAVTTGLRQEHRESFRPLQVRCCNGETQSFWAFTKIVRLKRYGRKCLVIVHQQADLSDAPAFYSPMPCIGKVHE